MKRFRRKKRAFRYRDTPNGHQIKGLELYMDPYTQKICETYNQTSSDTRSVLYILTVVSCLSLAAVFNSNPKVNWPSERIEYYRTRLEDTSKLLGKERDAIKLYGKLNQKDSLAHYTAAFRRDSLFDFQFRTRLDQILRDDVSNGYTVKIPIIGIQIDINDLAAISGAALIILLFLLRFTITREKCNVRIAFISITDRYTDLSDAERFLETGEKKVTSPLLEHPTAFFVSDEQRAQYLTDINFIRRRYHYNSLSMNEVFNLPMLDSSTNKLQHTNLGRFINAHLFYIFFGVYTYILFNDFCSYEAGLELSPQHTAIIMLFSICFFFIIFFLCEACVNQKFYIYRLFHRFWYQDYRFDSSLSFSTPRMAVGRRIVICIGLLLVMWLVSILINMTPDKAPFYNYLGRVIRAIFFIKK